MMPRSGRYVLACAFNEDFALPAAVALRSISKCWTPSTVLDVHIIDSGISRRSRSSIEGSIIGSRMHLHWCPIDLSRFLDLPHFAGMKSQIYHRFAIGEVVPKEVDRVVWLDMDVLVLWCLSELWEIDLKGQPIGAVQDMAIPMVCSPLGLNEFETLGLDPNMPYFNSGLMVLDMRLWRRQQAAVHLLRYVRETADRILHFDQHALNALYAGKWRALDPRWNVIANLSGRSFGGRHLSVESRKLLSSPPWIAHFAGAFKPWRIPLRRPLFRQYREVLAQVPIPTPPPGWWGRALAVYDVYFRRFLYPLERACWIGRYRFLRR